MKKEGKTILKKTVNYMINSESEKWPPICYGLYYQPKKPMKKKKTD